MICARVNGRAQQVIALLDRKVLLSLYVAKNFNKTQRDYVTQIGYTLY